MPLSFVLSSPQFQSFYTSASAMHGCQLVAAGRSGRVALPVKALKAGQESYWLDQIARNREEYFSGRGESPGRFLGSAAAAAGLEGTASPEQVRAMFQGLDPATGEQRCATLWRADPRSKLAAGPLLAALKTRAAEQRVADLEALAGSKALKGDIRSVQAACRLGGARRVKVETVERVCRKVLGTDPRELYGEGFERAWQHRGKRVNERVQAFDHCFSSPKSVSLLAAAASPRVRRLLAEGRAEALQVAVGYLERHGLGVRRDHNGTDRYPAVGGLVAVAFEHRMSRAGDPNSHTHVLVQNAAQGPDGRWTALDSDRLYAHLMAADHLYLAAERAALTERLGVRWGPVDERSGAAEIQGLDDRTLIERFSKRSEQIDQWLDSHGLSGIKASSAAAVATRAPKDYAESEQSVSARWGAELAEQGVGERQLAEVCSGGRGRPATRTELDAVLDALAGPDGLTGQVSTFTRTEVVDALARRLPVAPSAAEALTQAEAAADRFLAERAVRVGHDRRLGVDRFSTPELLALERQLVDGATARADERCAVVRPEVVRQVLDRHTSVGEDQAAMVRDLTQGGTGVAVVVGRAGSGKTWALGLAREAFELAGYQVLGSAPTGIATVGLNEEGFADTRTVDRLLLDLQGGRTELDERTVLVVDEAAMVATRKLAPLLAHADRAGAKVVLVGDDRQFASIAAGGGFRALRLRLGASELTVNRRQEIDTIVWEEVAARTSDDSTFSVSFGVLMVLAGIIAAIAIVTNNPVLVVGAMIVSPDYGPMAALSVALVNRALGPAWRSFRALALGFPLPAICQKPCPATPQVASRGLNSRGSLTWTDVVRRRAGRGARGGALHSHGRSRWFEPKPRPLPVVRLTGAARSSRTAEEWLRVRDGRALYARSSQHKPACGARAGQPSARAR
jgi:conjugative relaxase-like TrwC/TraI family protein